MAAIFFGKYIRKVFNDKIFHFSWKKGCIILTTNMAVMKSLYSLISVFNDLENFRRIGLTYYTSHGHLIVKNFCSSFLVPK